MSNIRVRLKSRQAIRTKLRPQQGVKVDNQKLYLYDPSLIDDEVALARDWAIKTDGLVEEEDYSSKAWAIGGMGTETNNSKYYASQAATSASNAYTSETNAAASASTATAQAGIATTQAGIATTKAGEASTSATNAYNSVGQAATSATSASNSADQSKQWAIGVPTEPADGSAKYWAGQAQSAVESIGDATLTIQTNGSDLGTFTANATVDKTIDIPIPTTAAEVNALPDTTKYGATITASLNTTDYKLTLTLKDQNGNTLGTAQVIDFPIESVVVNGSYDSVNKKIILTLQNGTTIDIPVGDLVSGLQTEITSSNKLASDLVDDTGQTNKFVTTSEKSQISTNASAISSLQNGKADKATTLSGYGITDAYTKTEVNTALNAKQDTISDLATIRSNATAGKSASDTIATYGNIVTHNVSEFATSAQGALADSALQSGDNVSELVNDSGYITGITSSDVTTALGYTPYNSTNPNGYITSSALSGYATETWVGSQGYITGITSSDVTTALGYTPYDSSNPNGYTSNVGTVTSVNNTSPDGNGNVSLTIPTVNNSTITLTQGGVTKGSFTLNQSSGATIDFDASSGAPSFATITGQPTDNANLAAALSAKYDASNPDGYQANVIETVKVNGTALTPVSKAVDVTVPTKTSDLTNDSGFITSSALTGYATENYVDTGLNGKQATLVSGTNIKTINNQSLLGSGNIDIQGGGAVDSVNGQTGAVVLTASDVGALPDSTVIPTEATVSGWGFTKNVGTVTSVNNVAPVNGNVSLSIPTVNNATLTIQKNGTNVATFTANASSNVTANIGVPNIVSSVSSSSTNDDAVGAKLFYDTCGDIEALINAL